LKFPINLRFVRLAGSRALTDFLEQIEREKFRID